MPEPRCCEQGYAVFREAAAKGAFLRGHVGIFEGCDGTGNHSSGAVQWIWEALPDEIAGVQRARFSQFRTAATFSGIRTVVTGLSPVQQQLVLDAIRSQQGVPGDYFRWKSPGSSFRCDGLLCWAYEEAGINLGYSEFDACSPGALFDRLACVP
jgi:hypothetical protein